MSTVNSEHRLSFEFFPSKTEQGFEKLKLVWKELSLLKPEFYSVTYGAGGSTRDNTFNIVKTIAEEGHKVAPHLSFGGDDETSMLELLNSYKDMGIERIVALRGDMPSGIGTTTQLVYASELIEFIRKHFGEQFHLEVAAYPEVHPESKSYTSDIDFLKMKFDCGADSAITQLFYNADAYFYFMEDCQRQGIEQPVYAGIMPVTNFSNLKRFAGKSGFDIPRWMSQRFDAYEGDAEAIKQIGIETVSRLCEQLLNGGAPGIHFYTMNTVSPTTEICANLGWTKTN